jgi:hypothetical protein
VKQYFVTNALAQCRGRLSFFGCTAVENQVQFPYIILLATARLLGQLGIPDAKNGKDRRP